MKAHAEMKVQFHSFLTSTIEGGEDSVETTSGTSPWKKKIAAFY